LFCFIVDAVVKGRAPSLEKLTEAKQMVKDARKKANGAATNEEDRALTTTASTEGTVKRETVNNVKVEIKEEKAVKIKREELETSSDMSHKKIKTEK
jgi:hypothetical protein